MYSLFVCLSLFKCIVMPPYPPNSPRGGGDSPSRCPWPTSSGVLRASSPLVKIDEHRASFLTRQHTLSHLARHGGRCSGSVAHGGEHHEPPPEGVHEAPLGQRVLLGKVDQTEHKKRLVGQNRNRVIKSTIYELITFTHFEAQILIFIVVGTIYEFLSISRTF